jgi:DNA modification methylase
MNTHKIIQGDCREALKQVADESIHTCVTSPPYFGLRSYNGGDDEIGSEQEVHEYVKAMVDVFREVRRCLRSDGTLWLNLGDSYMSQKNVAPPPQTIGGQRDMPTTIPGNRREQKGLKHKDLIGIPWRVAFALQADGWWLRQDIIWHKPNPMPESVEDRCTKAHEYIFLLSKKSHYYYDHEAIKEESILRDGKKNKRSVWKVNTKGYKGAHFAVYPKNLILPCILAGCPEGGNVLDPFTGSGTTAVVALENNRNFVGTELNPDYIKLAEKRIAHEIPNTLASILE